MSLFLRLALRNVFRHNTRTAVALLAIAAGCAALIVNGGVIYNIFAELREDAIRGRHGHLQVYRAGYVDHHMQEPDRYLISKEDAERAVSLLREFPGVTDVTRRREFSRSWTGSATPSTVPIPRPEWRVPCCFQEKRTRATIRSSPVLEPPLQTRPPHRSHRQGSPRTYRFRGLRFKEGGDRSARTERREWPIVDSAQGTLVPGGAGPVEGALGPA